MARWRSRPRNSAIFYRGSTGAIPSNLASDRGRLTVRLAARRDVIPSAGERRFASCRSRGFHAMILAERAARLAADTARMAAETGLAEARAEAIGARPT